MPRRLVISFLTLLVMLFLNLSDASLTVQTEVIYPDQDTYTLGGDINGLKDYLVADTSQTIFIRFPLDSVDFSTVNSTLLEMHNYADEVTTIAVYKVQDDAWDELSMTASNPPAISGKLDEIQVTGAGWYHWDVSDFVKAQTDGYASLALKATTTTGRWQGESVNDNTAANHPHLAIDGALYSTPVLQRPVTATTTLVPTTTVITTTLVPTTTIITTNIVSTKTVTTLVSPKGVVSDSGNLSAWSIFPVMMISVITINILRKRRNSN